MALRTIVNDFLVRVGLKEETTFFDGGPAGGWCMKVAEEIHICDAEEVKRQIDMLKGGQFDA